MTVLAGNIAWSLRGGQNSERLAVNLSQHKLMYWMSPAVHEHPTFSYYMRGWDAGPTSAYPYNLPVSAGLGAKAGAYARSYKDDLYYRVHVKPPVVDFGNLINDEIRDLVIWNATFTFQVMTQPSDPSQPGVSLELPDGLTMPHIITANKEIVAKMHASVSGPPVIDSEFTFTIGGLTYNVTAIGRRILLWPFPPNWKHPLDDSYVFKSWVMRSANGKVQSGSVWGNKPRREIEYTVLLKRDDAARAENLLFGWQSRFYGVVCWPERTKTTGVVNLGTRVILCDTTNRSFAPGGFVCLYRDSATYESAEIQEVTPTSITVSSDLKSTWPIGTRVYPVFAGLINATTSGVRHTDGVLEMPVSFECEPSTTPGNTPVGPATPTYRGEELFLGRLNWASAIPFEFASDRQKLDFGTGRFYSFSESEFTPQQKEHNWFIKSIGDAQLFRNWLGRREGIARPCYMPTGNTDFHLIADLGNASNVMDCIDNEYSVIAAHAARRDIIVFLRNGTYYTRRITGAVKIPGGIRVSLDASWPTAITKESVRRISFLSLFRQMSNKATIRWVTDEAGTAALRVITDRTD